MSKIWFITGAGSGIGTGTAKAALRAGDRVVATGRNLEKVRKVYPVRLNLWDFGGQDIYHGSHALFLHVEFGC